MKHYLYLFLCMTVRQCCGRITAVQMDNLRGLLDIRRMNKAKNARIRELCVVTKEVVEERIDEGALWWFGYVERMENDRIAKRVYVGECVGSCSVGRQRKRWIDAVKESLRKEVWTSVKLREWCRIGVNGGRL